MQRSSDSGQNTMTVGVSVMPAGSTFYSVFSFYKVLIHMYAFICVSVCACMHVYALARVR